MNFKRQTCLALIVLLTATGLHAEILAWQSGTGKTVEKKSTVRESVTGLDSVTSKPAESTTALQGPDVDAGIESSIPWLRNIPSFSGGDLDPGAVWMKPGTVMCDISNLGHKEPAPVRVSVSYTLIGMTERGGLPVFHIRAEWYPLYIPSPAIAKRTGLERIAGASRMDIFWDNAAGRPVESVLVEEIQYRFAENTALLFTRETAVETREVSR